MPSKILLREVLKLHSQTLKKMGHSSILSKSRSKMRGKYHLEVVETASQYRSLLKLRKEIFVKNEGYPPKEALNGFERESVHILARYNNKYVGMISVKLDDASGLPLDKYVKSFRRPEHKIAEFDKFGVIDRNVHKSAFYELISAAYGLIRFCGYNTILIFTLKKKNENIHIYKKIGFSLVNEFILFNDEFAVMMILELDKTNGLMWKTEQLIKAAKRLVGSTTNFYLPIE